LNFVRNIVTIALGLFVLAIPYIIDSTYFLHIIIFSLMYTMLSTSLNLTLGLSGYLNLGHVAFFGIGAYVSGLLTLRAGWAWSAALLAGILTAGAAGYAIGRLTLQLRGAYFVIVTLAFSEVLKLVSTNWVELTRGPMGLPGIPAPQIGTFALESSRAQYYLALLLAAAAVYVAARLIPSRLGRALVGLRENEELAQSLGVNVYNHLLFAFVTGSLMAGAAGAFYAHYVRFLSPEVFSFGYTVTTVIMVLAGGRGTVVGPVLGAFVFVFIPELLRATTTLRLIIYAIILVIITVFLPEGIWPYLRDRSQTLLLKLMKSTRKGRAADFASGRRS